MSDERYATGRERSKCTTLAAYVKRVFDEQGENSDEWALLVTVHGLARLRELYAKAKRQEAGEA